MKKYVWIATVTREIVDSRGWPNGYGRTKNLMAFLDEVSALAWKALVIKNEQFVNENTTVDIERVEILDMDRIV